MALDIKALLANRAQFPDSLVITIPGTTEQVTIGHLRSLPIEDKTAFLAEQDKLRKDQQALEAARAELQRAQAATAALFNSLQNPDNQGAAAAAAAAAGGGADPYAALSALESDLVFGPAVKAIKHQSTQLSEALTAIKKLSETTVQMARGFIDDKVVTMLESIPNRDPKITDEAITAHAVANRLFTKVGVPDVRKAYRELTTTPMTQAELDAKLAEAEKKGREEAEKAAREAAAAAGGTSGAPFIPGLTIPRPGVGGAAPHAARPTGQKPMSLDEALAQAAKDPEIWKIAQGQA